MPTIGDTLAERYRLEFVDLSKFSIDHELFRAIPAELMLRYGFVPYRREGAALAIVVSDPTDLPMIDELGVLLATPIKVTVGSRSAIESILKKSESSQRVLEEATESFHLQLLKDDENAEDSLTVERLTSDLSPVIRLVDSTIYTAIQRPNELPVVNVVALVLVLLSIVPVYIAQRLSADTSSSAGL